MTARTSLTIVLAAGEGTRMRSSLPKVLHPIAGKPMLGHVLDTARRLAAGRICVVYGHGGEQVREALDADDLAWAKQDPQLGTGHAVLQALPHLDQGAQTLVLYGDVPLIRAETLDRLLKVSDGDTLALLTVQLANPRGYGRIVRADGRVVRIVEEKDADDAEREIDEVNTGILVAPTAALARWLLFVFAVLCLALGVIGVIVPGLPSTVFVLMAAWAAARSSPRLYRWLWFHPLFGSMLRNWANGGRVSRHAKWSASVLMALCAIILLVIDTPRWAAYSGCGFMACVLTWLWLRPAHQGVLHLVRWDRPELFEQALDAGKGVILALPHIGCWEMIGQSLAERYGPTRGPLVALYRPARKAWLGPLVASSRDRPGLKAVPTSVSGVRNLIRVLREFFAG